MNKDFLIYIIKKKKQLRIATIDQHFLFSIVILRYAKYFSSNHCTDLIVEILQKQEDISTAKILCKANQLKINIKFFYSSTHLEIFRERYHTALVMS